jgi:Xaa-Pro aminopeptidase
MPVKAQLDSLMQARDLAAFIVACDDMPSAPRDYLTGGAPISKGLIVKAVGHPPILLANPMELEEAAKSGLTVLSFEDLGWSQLVAEHGGDRAKAEVVFWGRALERVGVQEGRVGVYGVSHLNIILALTDMLHTALPQYRFVGEMGMTLFDEAYQTKGDDEIARMEAVAQRAAEVMGETWAFIAAHREGTGAYAGVVVDADGRPLTIGAVKTAVRRFSLERGLDAGAFIFAQGRDGGFPHSRGEAADVLRLGEAIVFDYFPRELGGGYFHDCTRTWSIGYAKPEVQQAYDQVRAAMEIAEDRFAVGMPTRALQEAVQDHFEAFGHATARSAPTSGSGYTHSLGHGVGLNIHERPSIGHLSKDTFQAGNLFTIEPGLYYPERGFGVRVEDTYAVRADGTLVSLSGFRKDLVIPLTGG